MRAAAICLADTLPSTGVKHLLRPPAYQRMSRGHATDAAARRRRPDHPGFRPGRAERRRPGDESARLQPPHRVRLRRQRRPVRPLDGRPPSRLLLRGSRSWVGMRPATHRRERSRLRARRVARQARRSALERPAPAAATRARVPARPGGDPAGRAGTSLDAPARRACSRTRSSATAHAARRRSSAHRARSADGLASIGASSCKTDGWSRNDGGDPRGRGDLRAGLPHLVELPDAVLLHPLRRRLRRHRSSITSRGS